LERHHLSHKRMKIQVHRQSLLLHFLIIKYKENRVSFEILYFLLLLFLLYTVVIIVETYRKSSYREIKLVDSFIRYYRMKKKTILETLLEIKDFRDGYILHLF
jgi:hypothetical protein